MATAYANAQSAKETDHNIVINTPTPRATLEISKTEAANLSIKDKAQGVLIPSLSQDERNTMASSKLVVGLQIFNTDKNCVDWWNGKTWQCMDGTIQDTHGAKASYIEEAEWTETRNFYKNNCPTGQQSKTLISFTGTGKGRGISPISLQDAKNKALENAKLNYNRLGQDYANANGKCEPAPVTPPTDPITITDPKLSIGNTKYWFSSIYDNDYLAGNGDVLMPTTPASWSDQTPTGDGILETKVLDVQGIIPVLNAQKDNAILIAIPITTPPSANIVLPGFTTYLTIPEEYTEDGKKGVVVFTWEPTTLTPQSKFFAAHIYAKDTDIKLKKLDIMKGMGSDHMGLSLGTIKYPMNASDNDPATWRSELDVRLISAIPDKRFNIETTIALDTQKRHQFFYTPVMGPDGKMWLGNNLGADYANIHHTAFNPGQQAKHPKDYHAYGSLLENGRPADGHELMTWVDGTSTTANKFTYPNLRNPQWTYNQWTDNCPIGWRTPDTGELDMVHQKYILNAPSNIQYKGYFAGGLRIGLSGREVYNHPSLLREVGVYGYWWGRNYGLRVEADTSIASFVLPADVTGMNTRCVKN